MNKNTPPELRTQRRHDPSLDPKHAAVGAYVIFMFMNYIGVSIAAGFELFVTVLAIGELLVFMGVVAPGFSAGTG